MQFLSQRPACDAAWKLTSTRAATVWWRRVSQGFILYSYTIKHWHIRHVISFKKRFLIFLFIPSLPSRLSNSLCIMYYVSHSPILPFLFLELMFDSFLRLSFLLFFSFQEAPHDSRQRLSCLTSLSTSCAWSVFWYVSAAVYMYLSFPFATFLHTAFVLFIPGKPPLLWESAVQVT